MPRGRRPSQLCCKAPAVWRGGSFHAACGSRPGKISWRQQKGLNSDDTVRAAVTAERLRANAIGTSHRFIVNCQLFKASVFGPAWNAVRKKTCPSSCEMASTWVSQQHYLRTSQDYTELTHLANSFWSSKGSGKSCGLSSLWKLQILSASHGWSLMYLAETYFRICLPIAGSAPSPTRKYFPTNQWKKGHLHSSIVQLGNTSNQWCEDFSAFWETLTLMLYHVSSMELPWITFNGRDIPV